MQLVIVTGMSGAGKSRAIDTLEDIGFFCVDNMTPQLIPTFVKILNDSTEQREKVAIAADVRLGDSFHQLFEALEELRVMECDYKILFLVIACIPLCEGTETLAQASIWFEAEVCF